MMPDDYPGNRPTRWRAIVTYRSDAGPVDVDYDLSEIADLDPLIERGPHWDTVVEIKIVRVNHNEAVDLTIEQAQQL